MVWNYYLVLWKIYHTYRGGFHMPTLSLMQLPKTKSAEEFEAMCADVLYSMYKIEFSVYGKKGQKQNGIDLVSQTGHIVAQCKNYYLTSYDKFKKQIQEDILLANNLPFEVHTFIVMTSLEANAKIQDYILANKMKFEIKIMFWDNIQVKICERKELLQKYYPQFFPDTSIPIQCRNDIISNVNVLRNYAERWHFNYQGYRVGYVYNEDSSLYNECVDIVNAVLNLTRCAS